MTAIRTVRALGAVLGLALAACGSAGPAPSRPSPTTGATTSTAPIASTTSTVAPASTTTTTPDTLTVTAVHGSAPAAPAPTGPPALDRAGDAGQAVVVTAAGYGATTATLTTWQRGADGGWVAVFGPWEAHVGRAGLAPPGEKREGDGRTPSGTYGFDFAFGVQPDPGVALPYRRVTGPSIVWDDVPSSPSYNLWVDGGRGEPMYVSPAYDYGAVIAYNTARTPGLGSAIFLHVSDGRPTSGCVSLPADRLVEVLRWLDPSRAPVIVIGVG